MQDRDPRLHGGRHQPGEDAGPRDRGERERGSATTCSTPASLTRSHCRILIILYCVTISISSIHTLQPQTCRSITTSYTWYIVSGINPSRPRFRRAFNMKPTEPNVMKMTHHDREYLLSQIAAVLSDLQRLVSQLSTVQIEEKEVSKVKILCQKITAPSLNFVSNDLLHTFAYDCNAQ